MRFRRFINESATSTTALQETLFAVGLAMYQQNGDITKAMLMDGEIFDRASKKVESDVALNNVFEFGKENPIWIDSVISSVKGLKKSKYSPRNNSIIYRGRSIMSQVYQNAAILLHKEGVKMNPDKWNPGDVWTSTLNSIPSFDNIYELNNFISDKIKTGELVPISLKKTTNAKVSYIDQSVDVPFPDYRGIKKPTTPFNIGIIIKTSDNKIDIDLRSFSQLTTSPVTTELLISGSSARHGKATPLPLIKKYNIPQTSLSSIRKSAGDIEVMKDNIIRMWVDIGYRFNSNQIEKMWAERFKDKYFVKNPAGYWRSIINALEIGIFLEKNKSVANDFVKDTVRRAFSVSATSSDFIKIM